MDKWDIDTRESKFLEIYDRSKPEEKYKKIENLLESNVENRHHPLFLIFSILLPVIGIIIVFLTLFILLK